MPALRRVPAPPQAPAAAVNFRPVGSTARGGRGGPGTAPPRSPRRVGIIKYSYQLVVALTLLCLFGAAQP